MSFYEFGRVVCKAVLAVCFKLKIEGLDNIPENEGFILCSNHRGYVDPVFLGLRMKPHLTFMAKAELFDIPILSPIIKKLGAFPIHRGKGDSQALETAEQVVKDGKVLAIFPEGKRSKEGALGSFKSGAALIASKTGGDVIPACIYFKGHLRFRRKVTVRFGERIKNEELGITGMDPRELKNASRLLHDRVEQLLSLGQ